MVPNLGLLPLVPKLLLHPLLHGLPAALALQRLRVIVEPHQALQPRDPCSVVMEFTGNFIFKAFVHSAAFQLTAKGLVNIYLDFQSCNTMY